MKITMTRSERLHAQIVGVIRGLIPCLGVATQRQDFAGHSLMVIMAVHVEVIMELSG